MKLSIEKWKAVNIAINKKIESLEDGIEEEESAVEQLGWDIGQLENEIVSLKKEKSTHKDCLLKNKEKLRNLSNRIIAAQLKLERAEKELVLSKIS